MARGAQALIVRVSLGHILLTPAKSLGTAILPILVVAANFTTFPQAQADRYDTLANRRDLKEMYNSKRSAIDDHGTCDTSE
jgi:hypothetical protein